MEKIKIIFKIKKIKIEKEKFYVLKVQTISLNKKVYFDETVVLNTSQYLFVGDIIEGEGIVEKSHMGQEQLKMINHELRLPENDRELMAFLKRRLKGIRESTIDKIITSFGNAALDKCLDVHNLIKIGVQKKTAEKIKNIIEEDVYYQPIYLFLVSNGFPKGLVTSVYERYGKEAIPILKKNPYLLCKTTKCDFRDADVFAMRIGLSYLYEVRIQEGVLYVIRHLMKSYGHVYIPKKELISQSCLFLSSNLKKDQFVTEANIIEALDVLETENRIVTQEEKIYLKEFFTIEEFTVNDLHERINSFVEKIEDDYIDQILNQYEIEVGFKMAKNQRLAVYMALHEKISILTGGPGTGKTQTLRAIIYVIQKIYDHAIIHLAAPTGKASKRMGELTGLKAKTIHRLIKLNPLNPSDIVEIDPDYLIIDEASMIDSYLFFKLLKATSKRTKILLVGDYDQLPSVGAGNVLFNLIESKKIATTRLNEIFRQAQDSQIVMNAHIINKGSSEILVNQKNGDFFFINKMSEDSTMQCIFESIDRLRERYGFSLDDIQVLTATKGGKIGVNYINQLIQDKYNLEEKQYQIGDNVYLKLGDRVMQMENNYDLMVFNGETGNVIEIDEEGNKCFYTVDYGDRTVIYNEKNIEEVSLSYATTIHKSQGSEYPAVIIPFSNESMLNKNIIYTAITRARKMVIMIGNKDVLNISIHKKDMLARYSQLDVKLIESFNI